MNRFNPDSAIRLAADRFSPFAAGLQAIFADMDLAYRTVAEKIGFHCTGCEDNCCRTRFCHHTYLEWCYLRSGWERLHPQQQAELRSRASDVCRQMATGAPQRGASQQLCPLNLDGLCGLYEYRPMICRLHGIPHALQRPDGGTITGPGCDAFHRHCQSPGNSALDRTPHYAALAALEQKFRRAVGLTHRPKLTVAEMIIRFDG